MAPRQRNKQNKPYPKNWRLRKRGDAYYITFRVPENARHLWEGKAEAMLGKGKTIHAAEQQAYQTWTDRIAINETPFNMGQALDRYQAEVVPGKAESTQKSNNYSIARLRKAIPSDMPVIAFRTHHAYRYRDQCAKFESPKKANLDMEVLSHLFTKCFEWGVPGLIEHPMIGKIKKLSLPPRERYVDDQDFEGFLSVAGAMLNAYCPMKLATGIDKNMMLRIHLSDIKHDRLTILKRHKIRNNPKAKGKDYPFFDKDGNSTGLKEVIDAVLAWRKKHVKVLSPWLFCTSLGEPYIKENGDASGFNSIWQRRMKKAIDGGLVSERFTEHDICAKSASDVETLEQASQLRGHLNPETTEKIYRRKNKIVIPLKKG